jgi:hypothetical protein
MCFVLYELYKQNTKQVLRQFMCALHRYHTALHARQQMIQEQEALAYADATGTSLETSTVSSTANSPAKHSQQQQQVSHTAFHILCI